MVSDSANKMASFSASIRAFKNTESTAKGMIDTIYNVLDQDSQATVSVVKEIGQIFEEDGLRDKAKDILEAINGFRAQVSLSPLHEWTGAKLTFNSKNRHSHLFLSAELLEVITLVSHLVKSSEQRIPLTPLVENQVQDPSGTELKLRQLLGHQLEWARIRV